MTLEELRVCMMGGASHCSQRNFAAMARLAEERLLLERLSEKKVNVCVSRLGALLWEIECGDDAESSISYHSPTLSEAIRKAAGVSDAK